MKAICEFCHKEFEKSKFQLKMIYCNSMCRDKNRREKLAIDYDKKPCVTCKDNFTPKTAKQTRCLYCINTAKRKKESEEAIETSPKQEEKMVMRANTPSENDMIKNFLSKQGKQ